MRPTNNSSVPPAGRPEGPSGLGSVAGTEVGVVDPGGHDPDPGRVGPVEIGDLVGLDAARGQHGVRAADDGRLGLGPLVGQVGRHLLGAGLGLHPVQRVEGADQRQVERA